jgi:hypothetical protein
MPIAVSKEHVHLQVWKSAKKETRVKQEPSRARLHAVLNCYTAESHESLKSHNPSPDLTVYSPYSSDLHRGIREKIFKRRNIEKIHILFHK